MILELKDLKLLSYQLIHMLVIKVIGNDDEKLLKPVLNKLIGESYDIKGPYASDSFFGSQSYKNFDAIVATYHDQGLIPFKTLTFGKGVNFTAGLDIVRTSPDHGKLMIYLGKILLIMTHLNRQYLHL